MLHESLSSKPLPAAQAWVPPVVQSAVPVAEACISDGRGDLRKLLQAAAVLATAQLIAKLATTNPAPEVLLQIVEAICSLSTEPSLVGTGGADHVRPRDTASFRQAILDVYGLNWQPGGLENQPPSLES